MKVKRKDIFCGDQRYGKEKAWGKGRGRQEERSSSSVCLNQRYLARTVGTGEKRPDQIRESLKR